MSHAGIILAAGRSERMGETKALLKTREGLTFIAGAIRMMHDAGITSIVVVTNDPTAGNIRAAVNDPVIFTVNPRPEDGMVSSIRIGLGQLADPDQVLVTLVDVPDISADVSRRMMAHTPPAGAWMLMPRYRDGQGHPVLLYRLVFAELAGELPLGLKTLVARAPDRIAEIAFDYPQPRDIDTPADYERWYKR